MKGSGGDGVQLKRPHGGAGESQTPQYKKSNDDATAGTEIDVKGRRRAALGETGVWGVGGAALTHMGRYREDVSVAAMLAIVCVCACVYLGLQWVEAQQNDVRIAPLMASNEEGWETEERCLKWWAFEWGSMQRRSSTRPPLPPTRIPRLRNYPPIATRPHLYSSLSPLVHISIRPLLVRGDLVQLPLPPTHRTHGAHLKPPRDAMVVIHVPARSPSHAAPV